MMQVNTTCQHVIESSLNLWLNVIESIYINNGSNENLNTLKPRKLSFHEKSITKKTYSQNTVLTPKSN